MPGSQNRHTDSEYEAELQQVRDNLLGMAHQVEAMIRDSVASLAARDVVAARATIEGDRVVNRLELDTDELCLLILAKRQPVASDLRFITLAMKMVTDLERVGDLAVNICERTLALDSLAPEAMPPIIDRMGQVARQMVREAIEAFVERDGTMARQVWTRDSEIDDGYHALCNDVQGRMADGSMPVERGVHLQAVGKFLERIGDHANNLAEMVVFMVEGTDVRHEHTS